MEMNKLTVGDNAYPHQLNHDIYLAVGVEIL